MLKLFFSTAELSVGQTGLSLEIFPAKFKRSHALPLERRNTPSPFFDLEHLSQQIVDFLSPSPHSFRFLDIVISDGLLKYFMVVPPINAKSVQDYHAAAKMRFEHLYGQSSDSWQIEAEWQFGKPSLACAIPKLLLSRLIDSAQLQHHIILSIQPNFIQHWNIWRARDFSNAWFAVASEEVFTVGIVVKEQLQMVRTVYLPESLDEEWLIDHIAKEAMLLNFPMPDRIQVVGDIPESLSAEKKQKLSSKFFEITPNLRVISNSSKLSSKISSLIDKVSTK